MSRWNRIDPTAYGFTNTKLRPERTSIQTTMIRVLQYLANSAEDAPGFTQHELMTIQGLPTQNWTRFEKMMRHLVRVGLVEQSRISALNLFKITREGRDLVRSGLSLLDKATGQKSSSAT